MVHVSTAAGPVSVEDLGCTLMHEHVTLKMAGSEANTLHPGPKRTEMVARTLDWVAEIKARGVSTIVDPAPGDMGRDLELCAELGARAGLNIVCATGLFNKYHVAHGAKVDAQRSAARPHGTLPIPKAALA